MKKRLISIVLVLCVLLSTMPVAAFAAEADAVTFTAIDGTGGNWGESYDNIFDGKNSSDDYTKWCVENINNGTPYVVIKASSAVILKSYTFITGNDTASYSGRNPKAWTVYGSNDYNESAKTGTWTAVHTVTNGEMPAQNFASKTFTVSGGSAYKYFKYVISEVASTEGNTLFQLCGMELFGELEIIKDNITDYTAGETLEFGYYPQTEVTDGSILSALDKLAGVDYSGIGKRITDYSAGDTLEFGSYPQTRVTDESVIASLNTLANVDSSNVKTSTSVSNGWTSYGYYSGTGETNDGQMTSRDYMRYKDVVSEGNKYRGVVFDEYRPQRTGYTTPAEHTNGYTVGTVYWFKFEPVTWRVLDPAKGLVVSEDILDSQAYNDYLIVGDNSEAFGDADKRNYANNYAESSIRKWLNNDFYNTAFSDSEKNIIAVTELDNTAYGDRSSRYNSVTTNDKIHMLTYGEASNASYGFSSGAERVAKGSDYALVQGAKLIDGNPSWLLRSGSYFSSLVCSVYYDGELHDYSYTDYTFTGVRPSFNFDTKYLIEQQLSEETTGGSNTGNTSLKTSTSVENGWTSYNYYSGTCSGDNGQMKPDDYMRYIDIVYNGDKYRGVVFDEYRPARTGYSRTVAYSYQDDNHYTVGTVYWFKFEPITWRVLDPAKGVVLSETILDSQAFNSYVLRDSDDECYGDSAKTHKANDYAESSMRKWLNDNFYNTAFSDSQKDLIATTTLDNLAYSTSYSKYNSEATADKVYLLSYSDLINEGYGFSSSYSEYDVDRSAGGSDYAKSQGMWFAKSGTSFGKSSWRLRSAGNGSDVACEVGNGGNLNSGSKVDNVSNGTRPALNLNTTALIIQPEVNVANYTVETYTMNTSGTYVLTKSKLLGDVGKTAEAEYTVPANFNLNEASSVLSGEIVSNGSLVLKVYLDRNQYTFTTVVDGVNTQTDYYYGQTIPEVADPAKEGYEFEGWDKAIPKTMPAEDLTITARLKDVTAPTGEIKVGTNSWKTFVNNITFGLFFGNTQEVTITAADNSGEAVTIEYLLSDKTLTEAELASKAFTAYNGQFNIDPNNEYVIYAKLTDTTGNVTQINSSGIVLDNIAPVISGVEDGETYCGAQTVTVSDKYAVTVTVNDEPVTLTNGTFTLSPSEETQRIVAKDQAGNISAEITVTVNNGHTYNWQTANGKYWGVCNYCDHETVKKDIPEITITGADKVCKTQDYTFIITPPSGATEVLYGFEFTLIGDFGTQASLENGVYSGSVLSSMYDTDTSFKVKASATIDDGYSVITEKLVQIMPEHTGGTATCTEKAKCEVCGVEYGAVNPNNHTGEKVWDTSPTQHKQAWNCCGTITIPFEDHSMHNGICTACNIWDIPAFARNDDPNHLLDGVFQIFNAGQLFWFARYVNDNSNTANAELLGDIDLENIPWTPIGLYVEDPEQTSTRAFYAGVFDGNNHVIKNLNVNMTGTNCCAGLFGAVGQGELKNFGIVNATITQNSAGYDGEGVCAGVVAGQLYNATVTNVYTAGTLNVTTLREQSGGIASGCVDSTLISCYTTYNTLIPLSSVEENTSTFTACYYSSDTANANSYGVNKPAESFTNGEVAWLLQNAVAETGGQVWGQALTGSDKDANPVFADKNGSDKVYKVTFVEDENTSYVKYLNAGALTVADPVKSDCTFEGWYTASKGGTQVTSITADTTLYAQFTPNSYIITSASFTLDESTYAVGKKIVDVKVSGTNTGLESIGGENYGYADEKGFCICTDTGDLFDATYTGNFAGGVNYIVVVRLIAKEGYTLKYLKKGNVKLNGTLASYKLTLDENDVTKATAYFKLDQLPTIPVTSLSFALDESTYAVGKKIVDVKVSGTNTGVLTIGAANSGYGQGFIAAKLELQNPIDSESNETFAAGTTYYIGVFLQATDGYSLRQLTKENVKLNGIAASSFEVFNAETQMIAYFRLPSLSNASATTVTGVDFSLDGYVAGGSITESTLNMSVTPAGALTSPVEYISDATLTKTYYMIGATYDKTTQQLGNILEDDFLAFETDTTYYLGVVMIPENGYSLDGLTKDKIKLGNTSAIDLIRQGAMVGAIFELPKLSAGSINFTLDMSTYAIGKKIVDIKVSGTNPGLVTIGSADTGYGNGFVVMPGDDSQAPISSTATDTFAADTSYVLRVRLSAQEGYSLADVSKVTLNNTIIAYMRSANSNFDSGYAYFMLPKLSTDPVKNITAFDFALDGYTVGSKAIESTLNMSVTPAGALTSPIEYVNPEDVSANRYTTSCYLICTKNEGAQGLVPILDDSVKFETGITYYLNLIIIPKDGYSFDGLTKDNFKLGSLSASNFLVNGSMASVLFELPQLSADSVNFTLDMNTYAVGKKIVDLKVSGKNPGLVTIGGADTGYWNGFVVMQGDESQAPISSTATDTFAAGTTYYLCVGLEATEGYSLNDLTMEHITLNNTITAFKLVVSDTDDTLGAAYFELPRLSAPADIKITGADFMLGGYAIGNKVLESAVSMSVTPAGALTSPIEYVNPEDVSANGYTTTCFAICAKNESNQMEPLFDDYEKFETGVTYYLYVIMIPKDGYSFADGLTRDNFKLGNITANELVVDGEMRCVIFELPQLSDTSVNFTLDMSTYATDEKIVDLKVSGTNSGFVTIGGTNTGYFDGFVVAKEMDDGSLVLFDRSSVDTFDADTTYYLLVRLDTQNGQSLEGFSTEDVKLNNIIVADKLVVDSADETSAIAYFKLPQLSSASGNSITSVNFALGGYAAGSKVIDSTLSMRVSPNGALTSPAEYIEMGSVPTKTYFVICTDYDESTQSLTPLFGDNDILEIGVTYYLDVIMVPADGYNFDGLTKDNVKLGNLSAFDLIFEDGVAIALFKLPPLSDYSWYTNNTSATEFTISTVSQFLGFVDLVNGANGQTVTDFEGKTVKLGANLDLSGVELRAPIGMDDDHLFKGTFDGNGKTISNITINSSAYIVGLFGYVDSGTLKNLNASGSVTCATDGESYVGGIAGAVIEGKVENCSFSGSVTGNNNSYIGGIVGIIFGDISGCSNFATVGGNGFTVGGIVGDATGNIRYCYNQGNVTTNRNDARVGGIVGAFYTDGEILTVYSCYNTGSVSGGEECIAIGGIVGYIQANSGRITLDKVYYLDSVAARGIGDISRAADKNVTDNIVAKTADEFARGEVAYLLQNGVSAEAVTDEEGNEVTIIPLVWGQKSSTDGSAPILTSNEDYRVLPVMDGEAVVNYSVLKKGETNSDGVVNIYDYQNTVNIALSDNNLKTFSEKYDLNGDGVLDVLDISIAERSGMSETELAAFGEAVAATEGMCYIKNADLDGDGVVDVLDISLLERLMAGHRVEMSLD